MFHLKLPVFQLHYNCSRHAGTDLQLAKTDLTAHYAPIGTFLITHEKLRERLSLNLYAPR